MQFYSTQKYLPHDDDDDDGCTESEQTKEDCVCNNRENFFFQCQYYAITLLIADDSKQPTPLQTYRFVCVCVCEIKFPLSCSG